MAMGMHGAKSQWIRDQALAIISRAMVDERDIRGEITAIHEWVQKTIRYVRDPVALELLTYPEDLARNIKTGDCDDHAMLEAALLGAIGIPTRFVVVGFSVPGSYSHVYLEAKEKADWLPLEPIVKNKPVGWEVPAPIARKVYPTNSDDGIAGAGGRPSALGLLGIVAIGFFVAKSFDE